MSAPAMKLSGLPEISTTPLISGSPSTWRSTDSNSPMSDGRSVFTAAPGASMATTSTSPSMLPLKVPSEAGTPLSGSAIAESGTSRITRAR